jgi:predicted DNA-binding transcriptional regulator AlpA
MISETKREGMSHARTTNVDPLLDVRQVGALLSLGKSKIYDLWKSGRLKSIRHPDASKLVSRASWVQHYIDEATRAAMSGEQP